METAVIT